MSQALTKTKASAGRTEDSAREILQRVIRGETFVHEAAGQVVEHHVDARNFDVWDVYLAPEADVTREEMERSIRDMTRRGRRERARARGTDDPEDDITIRFHSTRSNASLDAKAASGSWTSFTNKVAATLGRGDKHRDLPIHSFVPTSATKTLVTQIDAGTDVEAVKEIVAHANQLVRLLDALDDVVAKHADVLKEVNSQPATAVTNAHRVTRTELEQLMGTIRTADQAFVTAFDKSALATTTDAQIKELVSLAKERIEQIQAQQQRSATAANTNAPALAAPAATTAQLTAKQPAACRACGRMRGHLETSAAAHCRACGGGGSGSTRDVWKPAREMY